MKVTHGSIGLAALLIAALGCKQPEQPAQAPSAPEKAAQSAPASDAPVAAVKPAPVPSQPVAAPVAAEEPKPAEPSKTSHPADAKEFGGHWYKAFDEDIPWHDGKKRCEELGGYLTCIETEAEQKFIADLCEGRYLYLGATDEAKEDTWIWVNGSKWEYTSWMDGQPNNYGGDENYLATYDGGEWVDVAAEGSGFWMPTGFICEWDK